MEKGKMMSKWIKLEDAINDLDDLLDYLFADDIKTPTALKQVKADLLNLPTIEINEYANKDEAFMKGYAKGSIEGYVEGRASVEVGKDCISREQAIEAIDEVDWYHINRVGELVHGAASDETALYRAEDIYKAIESLPSIAPNATPVTETQTNPCDGCVCDDGKHLLYCLNCKDIAWKTEPPKIKDEPQTETEHIADAPSKDHSGETTEMVDERCRGCKHYRLTCDMFSEICKYEPSAEQSLKIDEWEWKSQDICDNCGYEIPHLKRTVGDTVLMDSKDWHYCPLCGAKMGGDE